MNRTAAETLQSHLADLFGRINYERRAGLKPFGFKLDGIRNVLSLLGDPHLSCPVIHVAGTKGKGSVSRMIGAILHQAGYRTGVYTSPHLDKVNQRISVNGQPASDTELSEALGGIRDAVEKVDQQSQLAGIRPLTFFEVITTAAIFHFAHSGCDAVVLEVGMGGRLDSTNVCKPDLCVVTNIGLDHTRQLGDTLEKIAAEKAGIIKPDIPVISGVTKRKPQEVIQKFAQLNNAELWQLGRDFHFLASCQPGQLQLDTWSSLAEPRAWNLERLSTSLLGEHQATNASIAIAAAKRLASDDWTVTDANIRDALTKVCLPGRTEVASIRPRVIIDMAHNVVSIEALLQTLVDHFPDWNRAGRKRLVLAISRDKDARGILRLLVDAFDEIVLTKFTSNPRGKHVNELLEHAETTRDGLRANTKLSVAANPLDAWKQLASNHRPDDFICITGSVFLVAELRDQILRWSSNQSNPT